ncbi:MAG: hypothetical protein H5T74_10425 [Actinobacteria bacterium]|nr:hypothetical protein [Actinomycetota bacterium]
MNREALKRRIEEELTQEISLDLLDYCIGQLFDDSWKEKFTEEDLENILDFIYNELPHPGAGVPRRIRKRKSAPGPPSNRARYENERKARQWDRVIRQIRAEFLGQEEPLTREKADKWRRSHQADEFAYRLEIIVSKETLEKILKMEDVLVASREEETFFELGMQSGDRHLSRFKLRCQALADKIGFPLEDTMRLVLFGEVPETLTWMTVYAASYGAFGISSAGFTISGDLREKPHEIARLYRERRKAFMEAFGERIHLPLPKERNFKTELLLAFKEETPSMSWRERLEAWNERFPEYAYKTEASMRVAHSKAKRKGV